MISGTLDARGLSPRECGRNDSNPSNLSVKPPLLKFNYSWIARIAKGYPFWQMSKLWGYSQVSILRHTSPVFMVVVYINTGISILNGVGIGGMPVPRQAGPRPPVNTLRYVYLRKFPSSAQFEPLALQVNGFHQTWADFPPCYRGIILQVTRTPSLSHLIYRLVATLCMPSVSVYTHIIQPPLDYDASHVLMACLFRVRLTIHSLCKFV